MSLAALLLLPHLSLAQDRTLDTDDVVRRRERVDPGDEVSDFNVGDLDVKVQLGFAGNSLGPQTLITSFFNWFELQLSADLGVIEHETVTLGLGVETWLGRPWIPETVADMTSTEGRPLDWRAATRGVVLRSTLHYTGLSSLDPYVSLILGPSFDVVRVWDRPEGSTGKFTSTGLRMGVGGGLNVVTSDRIVAGVELRYMASPRFRTGQAIPIMDSSHEAIDSFNIGRAQRAPRGFSWIGSVGLRF